MEQLTMTDADMAEFNRMVRKVKFFNQMTVGLLEDILAQVMLYQYAKGENICKQGDPGDSFYVLYTGKLNVLIKKGFFSSAKKVATLNPGDFFGEMALLNREPRNATIECEEDSTAFVLLAEHFNEVAGRNPDFSAYMKNLAAQRKFQDK